MNRPACDGQLTDEQSFQEMIEGFAAIRPQSARRHFPRFPTDAALSGQLGAGDYDGLLVCGAENSEKIVDLDLEETQAVSPLKGFHLVDFSERGFQIQFQCEDIARFFNHSLSIEIGSVKIPVAFSWCRQSPPIGRGGISFAEGADGNPALAHLIAKIGEDLVRFLVSGLKEGHVNLSRQTGVYTCYALLYSLRLQYREVLASLWDQARDSEKQFENIEEIEQSMLVASGLRFGKWDIDDTDEDPPLDPVSTLFMKPFHEFGCALIGLREDSLLLKRDALAAVKRSILLPRQRRMEKVKILPRFRFLYQALLELRKLFPGTFDDAQFDFQFGYYSALVNELEALKEELVYKAHESSNPNPSYYDPFDVYTPQEEALRHETGLVFLGPDQSSTHRPDKEVNVFVHSGKPVSIGCPNCGNMSVFPAEQMAAMNGASKVRCSCGSVFSAFFERRRYFRKTVRIYGKYKTHVRLEHQPMLVKDLSRGGLCFEVLAEDWGPLDGSPNLKIADTLTVEFRLDNDKRSVIRGEIGVRSLHGTRVGGEFTMLDGQSKKDLGFYFMS